MPKINYIIKRFSKPKRAMINKANEILDEYAGQGFVLTLRQLYYQFVARDLLPNHVRSYKRLGEIIGDGRLAGLIDWSMIEDRTRNLQLLTHFDGADDALQQLAGWYHVDMWADQRYRPEVWIEKDALTGVIQGVCNQNDVPYFSCRGYTSLSEMWQTSRRLDYWTDKGQIPYIIHFGDHDPSGMDMSRDIIDRLKKTFGSRFEFERVALNMDQIVEYGPPPNPAKVTDSRYKKYQDEYGDESWELDALEPVTFRELIEDRLNNLRDKESWNVKKQEKERVRDQLKELSTTWEEIPELRTRVEDLEGELEKTKKSLERLKKIKRPKKS